MNKFVYQVFKVVILSVVVMFALDLVIYIFNIAVLTQKVETISASMQQVVAENNHLPKEQAEVYQRLICEMASTFNLEAGQSYNPSNPTEYFKGNRDAFIGAIDWNFKDSANNIDIPVRATRKTYSGGSWSSADVSIVQTKMGTPANYGDIQVIQLSFLIYQPTWGFFTKRRPSGNDFTGNSVNSERKSGSDRFTHVLTYTYYVPCLKYTSYWQ